MGILPYIERRNHRHCATVRGLVIVPLNCPTFPNIYLGYDERVVRPPHADQRVTGLFGPTFYEFRDGNVVAHFEVGLEQNVFECGPQIFGRGRRVPCF